MAKIEELRKQKEEGENILRIIKKDRNNKKSEAKRIKNIMYRMKGWRKNKKKITKAKQPVMFFRRRTGDTEIYEKVTSGIFEYKHTDGEERYIIVNPKDQEKVGWGDIAFKAYFAHEDYPTTSLPEPLINTEQMNTIIEKSLQDLKKYKAQELKYKGRAWLYIAAAIGLIIMAFALYKLLVPQNTTTIIQAGTTAGQLIQQNMTPTIL